MVQTSQISGRSLLSGASGTKNGGTARLALRIHTVNKRLSSVLIMSASPCYGRIYRRRWRPTKPETSHVDLG
jgi:hypothetical protein